MASSGGLILGGIAVAGGLLAWAFSRDAKADTGGGGGGGGGVPLEKMTCAQAFGLLNGSGAAELAKPAQDLLSQPVTPATAAAATKMAQIFREGVGAFPEPVAGAMRVIAQCLDDYAKGAPKGGGPAPEPGAAGVQVDMNGTPVSWDGGPAKAGYASNPKFQWLYPVLAGDSAQRITAKFFGSAQAASRYRELVALNPREFYSKRNMGITGDYNNPNSSGYNWTSLRPDDRLLVPQSWNAWIDQQGNMRGQAAPFPNP